MILRLESDFEIRLFSVLSVGFDLENDRIQGKLSDGSTLDIPVEGPTKANVCDDAGTYCFAEYYYCLERKEGVT